MSGLKLSSGKYIGLFTFILFVGLIFVAQWHTASPLTAALAEKPVVEQNNMGGLISPTVPTGHFETVFLPDTGVHVVADATTIYSGLYRSKNGGETWQLMTDPAYYANEVQILPSPNFSQDETLFARLDYGTDSLRISHNGGESWSSPQEQFSGIPYTMAVSPDFISDETLFAALASPLRLAVSHDQGEHWDDMAPLPTDGSIQEIVVSPSFAQNQTLYAKAYSPDVVGWVDSLWLSTNGGNNWVQADNGLGTQVGTSIYDIDVAAINASTDAFFATTSLGTTFSSDGGQTWYLLSEKTFWQIAVPPNVSVSLTFWGVESVPPYSLLQTTDLGETWQTVILENAASVSVSPTFLDDQTIYARASSGLWVTRNGGGIWKIASSPAMMQMYFSTNQVLPSPNYEEDGIIFATTGLMTPFENGVILRSEDYGRSWTTSQISGTSSVRLAISSNFVNDQTVFAIRNNHLYQTTDAGDVWNLLPTPLPSSYQSYRNLIYLSPNYPSDHTIFIKVGDNFNDALYRSEDGGMSWENIYDMDLSITDFAVSPEYPTAPTIFVTAADLYGAEIFRSDDGGTTWNVLDDPPLPAVPNEFIIELSPRFDQDGILFVVESGEVGGGGLESRVYRSNDRGESWEDITGPDLTYYIAGLAVSPNFDQDQTIIVSILGESVFMSEDAGVTWHPLSGAGNLDIGLSLAYQDGLLRPFVGATGVFFYEWPEPNLPSIFSIPLEPGNTTPQSITFPFTDVDNTQPVWETSETADWLTIDPISGTLDMPLTLTADPTLITETTSVSLTLHITYSAQQTKSYIIMSTAFFADNHIYLPVIWKSTP